VAQALLPVVKADAFHAEGAPRHRDATVKKPDQATDETRGLAQAAVLSLEMTYVAEQKEYPRKRRDLQC
jgi:hypothetical protein